jgi:hypothetical protein
MQGTCVTTPVSLQQNKSNTITILIAVHLITDRGGTTVLKLGEQGLRGE